MNRFLTALLVCTLAGPVFAEDKKGESEAPTACPELKATTVFVKDKTGNRTTGSAERLTETHRKVEAQGWSFSGLETYIEDGDLKGFFVTYTRAHPCNKG